MTEEKQQPRDDEVTDEKLDEVAGGASEDTSKTTKKSSESVDGEAKDANHESWIEI